MKKFIIFIIIQSFLYSDTDIVLDQKILSALYEKGLYINTKIFYKRNVIKTICYVKINCSPDRLWNLLIDYKRYKSYIPKMVRSEFIKKEDNAIYILYELDLPWPAKDPLYITKNYIDSKSKTLTWDIVPEESYNMKINKGSWHIFTYNRMTILKEILEVGYPAYAPDNIVRLIMWGGRKKVLGAIASEAMKCAKKDSTVFADK